MGYYGQHCYDQFFVHVFCTNICVHFYCVYTYIRKELQCPLSDFSRYWQRVFQNSCINFSSNWHYMKIQISQSLCTLFLSLLFVCINFSHTDGYAVLLHCDLKFYFPENQWSWALLQLRLICSLLQHTGMASIYPQGLMSLLYSCEMFYEILCSMIALLRYDWQTLNCTYLNHKIW